MEELAEIRLLLPALITFVTLLLVGWASYEYRRYQKQQAMSSLDSLTGASSSEFLQKTKRASVWHRMFLGFSKVTEALGERINVFRSMKNKIDVWLRRAGVRDKNAAAYMIGAKLLGIPAMPALTFLLFSSYDFFQIYTEVVLGAASLFGFFAPDLWLFNKIQKRQEEVVKNWSDMLDVILISVSSGRSIELALRQAAHEMAVISPELAKELTITLTELSVLEKRSDAYRRMAERLPFPFVKNFVFDVIQSENLGTPLARALTQIAQEHRIEKMQEVEKKAAALGPKLTVPMILFFFPILFIIIMAPAFL